MYFKCMDFETILCFNDSINVRHLHDLGAIGAALAIISSLSFAPKGAGERVFLRLRALPASAKTPSRKSG